MSCVVLYVDNDNHFVVRGVKNSATKQYINDATVAITLLDEDGAEVAGQAWPLTLTYIAASNGDYEGTFDDAIEAEDGDEGTLEIAISATGGLVANLTLSYEYRERVDVEYWTSRRELEQMFGLLNVSQWADLENNQDADDIVERISWAVEEATEDAKLRLKGSPASRVTCAPRPLRIAVTRLAGVLLYESRGVKDVVDDEGRHRLRWHKSQADAFIKKVQAGILAIADDDAATKDIPAFFDECEEDVYDEDFFAE